MKRAADASILEFEATHRARLRFRRVSDAHYADGHPVRARVDIANIGESDARVFEVGIDLFFRTGPEQKPTFNAVPDPREETIPPGMQVSLNVIGGHVMNASQIKDIDTGSGQLCFLMTVNYRDRQNITRSVSAFRIYNPERRRFMHSPDDDEFAELEYEN
jgi:hypothetical protein